MEIKDIDRCHIQRLRNKIGTILGSKSLHAFELDQGNKSYVFSSEDPTVIDEWVSALKNCSSSSDARALDTGHFHRGTFHTIQMGTHLTDNESSYSYTGDVHEEAA